MAQEQDKQIDDFPLSEPSEKTLVEAAKEMGAVSEEDVAKMFDKAPTTKDIIGTGKLEFHKELPQIDFKSLVGSTFLLHQIQMVEDWDGLFGTSTFGLILVQKRDGSKATSLAGGQAVVKQLRGFINKRRFPVKVALTEKPGINGFYFLFE